MTYVKNGEINIRLLTMYIIAASKISKLTLRTNEFIKELSCYSKVVIDELNGI